MILGGGCDVPLCACSQTFCLVDFHAGMKNVVVVILGWIFCSAIASTDDQIGQAEKFLNSGRFNEALTIYRRLLATDPNNIDVLQGAAVLFANIGKFDQAAKLFDSAVSIKPAPELFFNAGRAHYESGNLMSAITSFHKCSSIKSSIARQCHLKLAQCYRDVEKFDDVQTHLLIAIQMDPKQGDAYSYLADTYNNLKQFKKAIEAYDTALQFVSPRAVEQRAALWHAKGDAFSNLKSPHEALSSYTKALELAPKGSKASLDALIGFHFVAIEMGEWRGWELNLEGLTTATADALRAYEQGQGPPSPLSPYHMLFLAGNSALRLEVANSWSHSLGYEVAKGEAGAGGVSPTRAEVRTGTRAGACQLHVGYLSRRFEEYPGTQMMLRLFGTHNRQARQ